MLSIQRILFIWSIHGKNGTSKNDTGKNGTFFILGFGVVVESLEMGV